MSGTTPTDHGGAREGFSELPPEEQIKRLHLAVETLAAWLVEAQTGFGKRDAEGIFAILDRGTSRE